MDNVKQIMIDSLNGFYGWDKAVETATAIMEAEKLEIKGGK